MTAVLLLWMTIFALNLLGLVMWTIAIGRNPGNRWYPVAFVGQTICAACALFQLWSHR